MSSLPCFLPGFLGSCRSCTFHCGVSVPACVSASTSWEVRWGRPLLPPFHPLLPFLAQISCWRPSPCPQNSGPSTFSALLVSRVPLPSGFWLLHPTVLWGLNTTPEKSGTEVTENWEQGPVRCCATCWPHSVTCRLLPNLFRPCTASLSPWMGSRSCNSVVPLPLSSTWEIPRHLFP